MGSNFRQGMDRRLGRVIMKRLMPAISAKSGNRFDDCGFTVDNQNTRHNNMRISHIMIINRQLQEISYSVSNSRSPAETSRCGCVSAWWRGAESYRRRGVSGSRREGTLKLGSE